MASKKMLEVNDLNKIKVTGSNKKNLMTTKYTHNMENTYNPREKALAMIAKSVEDYEDLEQVQAETGLEMAELESIYYSII